MLIELLALLFAGTPAESQPLLCKPREVVAALIEAWKEPGAEFCNDRASDIPMALRCGVRARQQQRPFVLWYKIRGPVDTYTVWVQRRDGTLAEARFQLGLEFATQRSPRALSFEVATCDSWVALVHSSEPGVPVPKCAARRVRAKFECQSRPALRAPPLPGPPLSSGRTWAQRTLDPRPDADSVSASPRIWDLSFDLSEEVEVIQHPVQIELRATPPKSVTSPNDVRNGSLGAF